MTHRAEAVTISQPWPRLWRMAVVAMGTLILCSCRGVGPNITQSEPSPGVAPPGFESFGQATGTPPALPCPWAPPGIRRPWPQDEYLVDGGDRAAPAQVGREWEVLGLDPEDTIAHFDTLDGRTLVEPSNRVPIYSPRFGSVRQVVSLIQNEQTDRFAGVHKPTKLVRYDDIQQAATSKQHIQAEREIGTKLAKIYRTEFRNGAISTSVGPRAFQDAFLPFENLRIIRHGMADQLETARLAEGVAAAETWTDNQAVQVILDHQTATASVGVDKLHGVFTVKEPPAEPKLRIVKIASTQFAKPGDVIDFTLRFDNVGNQVIGNVTLLDNLSTRLEFVPETAQCSIKADFRTERNEAGSKVLRWEITDPLPAGQGGVIRFRCRVR